MAETTDESKCEANDPDREICLCFHVSRRKIENFIRINQPKRPAQLSECFGAGTGCGWCRSYLTLLFEAHRNELNDGSSVNLSIPSSESYQQMRQVYREKEKR